MADKLKILIAEDVDSNYLYLKAVLSKIDAEILWAKNGNEAVRLYNENADIDLVLMDLLMPIMNGYKASKAIKMAHPDAKIIAQTALAMTDDREKALSCGCDGYIAKPIKAADLLNLINKTLNISA